MAMIHNLPNWFWVTFGFIGQGLFSMRFIVQWIASERLRRSVVPVLFWYFSLAGGVTLFLYALWREDPVFVVGQALGLFVYSRNLQLIFRERRRRGEHAPPATS